MPSPKSKLIVYICPNPNEDYKKQIDYFTHKLKSFESATLNVFAETPYIMRHCHEKGLRCISPEDFCNTSGIPLMNKIFKIIHYFSTAGLEAPCVSLYINSDIVMSRKLIEIINLFLNHSGSFFVSGRRTNVELMNNSLHSKSSFQHWGTDYFLFRTSEIMCTREYEIGRFFWDGHVLTRAFNLHKEKKLIAIDASTYCRPLHINHTYWWGKEGDKTQTAPIFRAATINNLRLTKINDCICTMHFPYEIDSLEVDDYSSMLVLKKRNVLTRILAFKYQILFIVNICLLRARALAL